MWEIGLILVLASSPLSRRRCPFAPYTVAPLFSRIRAGAAPPDYLVVPAEQRHNLCRSVHRFCLSHSNILHYKINRDTVSVKISYNVSYTKCPVTSDY